MHDTLLAHQPEGARHDASICPICSDKAQRENPSSRIPPGGDAGPDVSAHQTSPTNTEGGTPDPMTDTTSTISKETHEALLTKAVNDAVAASDAALATAAEENTRLKAENEKLTSEKAALETDNADLNKQLDEAQVAEKTATEKASQLEKDLAQRDTDAAKAEVASKRAEQVRNLKLFTDEQVAEKAGRWAELSEEDWTERLGEWAALKPASAETDSDAASAMSGTTEKLTDSGSTKSQDEASKTKPSARRLALGLS